MTTSKIAGLPLGGSPPDIPDLDRLSFNDAPTSGSAAVPASQTPAPPAPVPAPSRGPVHITINATGSTVIVNTGSPAPESVPCCAPYGAAGAHAVVGVGQQEGALNVPPQEANTQAPATNTTPNDGIQDVNSGTAVVVANGPGEEPFHLAPLPLTSINRLPWDNTKEYICPLEPRGKKWYAVTASLMVGIWPSWMQATPMVDGVPGNMHESFKSRAAAERYYFTNKDLGRVFMLGP